MAVECVDSATVEGAAERTRQEFELLPGYSEDHLQFQVRVAAGLATLIRDRQLNGLAYFHFGRGGDVHEQLAGGMAIGGTFGITDGIPIGTEFDLRAVIAMYILGQFSQTGSMFTELYSVNYEDGVVEVGHDGATNLRMTVTKPKIKPLAVFHGKSGSGNAVESTAAPGPVTHLALAELGDGSITFVVGEGAVVPGPIMAIGNTVSRVDFGCDPGGWVEAWSRSGSGHHFAMAHGHHARELKILARLLGVQFRQVRPQSALTTG
jgi:L-arabinose isomerase